MIATIQKKIMFFLSVYLMGLDCTVRAVKIFPSATLASLGT